MLKTSSGQTALAGLEKKLTGSVPGESVEPASVRKSVRLMLSGGAVTAAMGVFMTIVTIADKNGLTTSAGKKLTSGQFTSSVIGTVVQYAILVAIWVLMARFNRAGRPWARWIATALAIISTVDAYSIVNSLKGGETLTVLGIIFIVANLILWAIGTVAAVLLWRTDSREYFKAHAGAR